MVIMDRVAQAVQVETEETLVRLDHLERVAQTEVVLAVLTVLAVLVAEQLGELSHSQDYQLTQL